MELTNGLTAALGRRRQSGSRMGLSVAVAWSWTGSALRLALRWLQAVAAVTPVVRSGFGAGWLCGRCHRRVMVAVGSSYSDVKAGQVWRLLKGQGRSFGRGKRRAFGRELTSRVSTMRPHHTSASWRGSRADGEAGVLLGSSRGLGLVARHGCALGCLCSYGGRK